MHDTEKLADPYYRNVKSDKYNKTHIESALRNIGVIKMRNLMQGEGGSRQELYKYKKEHLDPALWIDFVTYLIETFNVTSEIEMSGKTIDLPLGWIPSVEPVGQYINIFSNETQTTIPKKSCDDDESQWKSPWAERISFLKSTFVRAKKLRPEIISPNFNAMATFSEGVFDKKYDEHMKLYDDMILQAMTRLKNL